MKNSLLVLIGVTLSLSACKNCTVDQVVSSGLSYGITKIGACKNPSAVKVLTDKWLSTPQVCSATGGKVAGGTKGPIAMVICPIIVPAIVSVVGTQIPQELVTQGGCDFSSAQGGFEALLISACNLLPVSPEKK